MKQSSTIEFLNLLSKLSKKTGIDKKELLKELCNKCKVNYSENITFGITASKECENIKFGDELIFDIFNKNLIDNEIYYFTYENNDFYYEDFGKYDKRNNSFTVFDTNLKINDNFNILGQLSQIKSRMEMI